MFNLHAQLDKYLHSKEGFEFQSFSIFLCLSSVFLLSGWSRRIFVIRARCPASPPSRGCSGAAMRRRSRKQVGYPKIFIHTASYSVTSKARRGSSEMVNYLFISIILQIFQTMGPNELTHDGWDWPKNNGRNGLTIIRFFWDLSLNLWQNWRSEKHFFLSQKCT